MLLSCIRFSSVQWRLWVYFQVLVIHHILILSNIKLISLFHIPRWISLLMSLHYHLFCHFNFHRLSISSTLCCILYPFSVCLISNSSCPKLRSLLEEVLQSVFTAYLATFFLSCTIKCGHFLNVNFAVIRLMKSWTLLFY